MSPVNSAQLHAKLVVRDADAAIAFYREAFGAEQTQRHTMGEAVCYAQTELLGTTVSLKDEDEHDPSPTTLGRPGVLFEITTDDPDSVAATVVRAGGEIVFEVADQPYGARGGRVRDPFGHEWLIQTPITLTDEEVQQALGKMG
ncbi:MAG: VOC family protein [Actinomycetota bacterium]|nr:VOC family protein [Actinomycetota bacterium]